MSEVRWEEKEAGRADVRLTGGRNKNRKVNERGVRRVKDIKN